MKRLLAMVALLGFTSLHMMGQQARCHTMDHLEYRAAQDPTYMDRLKQTEAEARAWLNQNKARVGGATLTIPVVVHVVYKDATQNISDAQVLSQIDVLNADFRRMNADTVNRRPEFDTLAADFEIEFCLATTDPDGNPTTGITRTQTQGGQLLGWFGPTDDVKSPATGGVSPWPTDQYLNIWVCDLLPILLGYAQFPGEDSLTDGVVIGFNYFGTTGTVTAPYDNGRTTTHEVGHWLGLRHIWGDGDCSMDDFVDDTPKADAANQGCLNVKNTCLDTPYDYNDMEENYMDYSEDGCMNMFTHGQKDRAWSFLNTDRLALATSNGCSLAVALDAGLPREGFRVYPNPGSGRFHLAYDAEAGGSLSVMDLAGRLHMQTDLSQQPLDELDLTGYAPGIYFVTFSAEGQRETIKLVVE